VPTPCRNLKGCRFGRGRHCDQTRRGEQKGSNFENEHAFLESKLPVAFRYSAHGPQSASPSRALDVDEAGHDETIQQQQSISGAPPGSISAEEVRGCQVLISVCNGT
jgi:hypothetical protein